MRDCFGRLCYSVKRSDGAVFEVTAPTAKILRVYPYYKTDAYIKDPVLMWDNLPRFESFMQAVVYLKKNINILT